MIDYVYIWCKWNDAYHSEHAAATHWIPCASDWRVRCMHVWVLVPAIFSYIFTSYTSYAGVFCDWPRNLVRGCSQDINIATICHSCCSCRSLPEYCWVAVIPRYTTIRTITTSTANTTRSDNNLVMVARRKRHYRRWWPPNFSECGRYLNHSNMFSPVSHMSPLFPRINPDRPD